MDSVELVRLARTLIDIDSTSGREAEASSWVARWLEQRDYEVVEQPVAENRFNVIGMLDPPDVVFSTHIDCVLHFFQAEKKMGWCTGVGLATPRGSWPPS